MYVIPPGFLGQPAAHFICSRMVLGTGFEPVTSPLELNTSIALVKSLTLSNERAMT